ncbi:MAG TPA: hypothetical protein VFK97_02435 [Candidatus Saccharimonadales bacterium]|nr:hypothetical protein [Candidatus Saccharimonadales bacterium]
MATPQDQVGETLASSPEKVGQVIPLPLANIVTVPEVEEYWYPYDLATKVFPDTQRPPWNGSIVEVAWTGKEGPQESKLSLAVYPIPKGLRVFEVGRPWFWGPDLRETEEQVREHMIGMDEAISFLIDPDKSNPLSQYPYTPPGQIEFVGMDGIAGEALARLGIPEASQRHDRLEFDGDLLSVSYVEALHRGGRLTTTFTFDRDLLSSNQP